MFEVVDLNIKTAATHQKEGNENADECAHSIIQKNLHLFSLHSSHHISIYQTYVCRHFYPIIIDYLFFGK